MKSALIGLLIVASIIGYTQTPTVLIDSTKSASTFDCFSLTKPLYVVNKKIVPCDSIAAINPEDILEIQVLRGASAEALYGPDGSKNGTIIIITKRYAAIVPDLLVSKMPSDTTRIITRSSNPCNGQQPIYVIDDKEMSCDSILVVLSKLKPDDIEDIQVLSLADTHKIYGNKGDPYGAIVFTTKEYVKLQEQKRKKTKKP